LKRYTYCQIIFRTEKSHSNYPLGPGKTQDLSLELGGSLDVKRSLGLLCDSLHQLNCSFHTFRRPTRIQDERKHAGRPLEICHSTDLADRFQATGDGTRMLAVGCCCVQHCCVSSVLLLLRDVNGKLL
jgi:hypothetical protein